MSKIVVVGAGLGGLATAIHLRLAGSEVMVLEQNPRTGGRANQLVKDGYTFDTGPSLLNYPWVFEQLFSAAGRRLDDYLELIEVEPGICFYWTDGSSLQLSSRFDTLRGELGRFDPDVGPRLAHWLERAGRNYRLAFDRLVTSNAENPLKWLGALRLNELYGLGLQNSLYRQLGRSFHSDRICQALGSYGMYLGGSPFELPGLFEILPFGEINYGLWLPRGGVYSLVNAMTELAQELGVDIRTGTQVALIYESGNRAQGVQTADGDNIAADAVVSNCDLPATDTQLLPPGKAAMVGAARARKIEMTPGVITFYWGLSRIPGGLGHHSIFLPDDYRGSFHQLMQGNEISACPPFYLSIASESDPGLAPPDKSTMFALIPTPVLSRLGECDWDSEIDKLRKFIFGRLSSHGLNLGPADIESETVFTPEDWQTSYSLYDGSAFGAAHKLFMLGPWRPANYSRSMPGLFYAGASTTPGTGMPLVTLGGKMTADRVRAYVC